ncbi:uncharacterized protein LOC111077675 [Drosophila obscura]|uniref:uncharacterized protein LOC111077675 n=1 Tax=Drosophila obscura TaxID=7282 RepID=UPI001BB1BA1E|nr:uncharacterized protein LOC111077675 [Drosophila obscura]
MISYISYFLIFYTATADNLKVLNYQNSAKTIVQDLIDNWQSPIGYLESRGYLPKDLQYAPDLNVDNAQNNAPQDLPQNEISKKQFQESASEAEAKAENDRLVRSFDKQNSDDVKKMFRRLFSSENDDTISDELKSKLDVSWDMNQLRATARREAEKCYEKFCKKRTQNDATHPTVTDEQFDSDIDAEIAQLYPSVLPKKKNNVKKKEVMAATPHKKPYQLAKGFGKILCNRQLGDAAMYKHLYSTAQRQEQKAAQGTQ